LVVPSYTRSNFTISCTAVSGTTLTVTGVTSRIPRGTQLAFISVSNVITNVTVASAVALRNATSITINETNPSINGQTARINNIMTMSFTILPIKKQTSVSNCDITNITSTYVPSDMTGVTYFNLNATNAFTNINIGDTVRVNSVSLPISGTPTIVVDKINNSNIVVEKGNVSDGVAAGTSTVVFNYEFPSSSATAEAFTNTDADAYTNNVTTTTATTIISHAI
jgi:hypothetical protein